MRTKLVLFFLLGVLFVFSSVKAPVLAQQPDLQTFTTDDKSFSFIYPADWTVKMVNADQGPNASISLENDQAFDSPDGLMLQIYLPKKSFEFGTSSNQTPKSVLAQMVQNSSQIPTINFGTASANTTPQPLQLTPTSPNVKDFTVANRPSAYAYNIQQAMGIDASQLDVIVDLGNDYWVLMTALSFKGGLKSLQAHEAVILSIAASMHYLSPTPVYSGNPDLPQVYSGLVGIWQRGYIKFYYPKDWYVSDQLTLAISNKPGNLINVLPQPGQFIAGVNGVSETRAIVDQSELYNQCGIYTDNLTAKKLVQEMLGMVTAQRLQQLKAAGITFTQPEETTVNGKDIVSMWQYQKDIEVLSLYIDLGSGQVASMSVTANKGDIAPFEKQLFAVAGTFEYTPKPCAATATPQPQNNSGASLLRP